MIVLERTSSARPGSQHFGSATRRPTGQSRLPPPRVLHTRGLRSEDDELRQSPSNRTDPLPPTRVLHTRRFHFEDKLHGGRQSAARPCDCLSSSSWRKTACRPTLQVNLANTQLLEGLQRARTMVPVNVAARTNPEWPGLARANADFIHTF